MLAKFDLANICVKTHDLQGDPDVSQENVSHGKHLLANIPG